MKPYTISEKFAPHTRNSLEGMLDTALAEFPEFQTQEMKNNPFTVYPETSPMRDGSAGREGISISPNIVERGSFKEIGHELTHLLRGDKRYASNEVECDIQTYARSDLFTDGLPNYLLNSSFGIGTRELEIRKLPEELRLFINHWNEYDTAKIRNLCIDAVKDGELDEEIDKEKLSELKKNVKNYVKDRAEEIKSQEDCFRSYINPAGYSDFRVAIDHNSFDTLHNMGWDCSVDELVNEGIIHMDNVFRGNLNPSGVSEGHPENCGLTMEDRGIFYGPAEILRNFGGDGTGYEVKTGKKK